MLLPGDTGVWAGRQLSEAIKGSTSSSSSSSKGSKNLHLYQGTPVTYYVTGTPFSLAAASAYGLEDANADSSAAL
jgi:hypothetical protein